MRPGKRLKRGATLYFLRALSLIVNNVPRRFGLFFGAMTGLILWRLLPRDRHRISRHLKMVYDDRLTNSECKNIGRSFFIKSGKNLIDLLRCPKHYHSELEPLIEVEGLEHFERAYKRGKGVIGFGGHIGNFELMAIYFAQIGYKAAAIGREMYDPKLDALLVSMRQANGVTNFRTTDSPRGIFKWLKDGNVLGVLIDIDSMRIRSEFVPVFGRPALTPVGQTILGLKTGAAFIPIACVRTENDCYKIIIKPEITVVPSGDFDRDVIAVTAACSLALEPIIDQYRDQWIWLKNRWGTQLPENT
jgi:KDO2-lipid IV(A) lauroyltransferase